MRATRPSAAASVVGATMVIVPALVACTAFATADDAASPPDGSPLADAAGDARPADPVDAAATDGAPGGPSDLVFPACGGNVFCDDFEGAFALPRAWSGKFESAATLSVQPGAGNQATQGLVATAGGTAPNQQAFVRRDLGAAPATYRVRVKWAGNTTLSTGTLSGVRLYIDKGGVGRRDVVVRHESAQVGVYYNAPGCGNCLAPPPSVPIAAGWHEFVLVIEVDAAKPPFGRVRLHVDGMLAIDDALGVPIDSAGDRAVFVGISATSNSAKGMLALDDVIVHVED